MPKIKQLLVAVGESTELIDSAHGEITEFKENGEMAEVKWFRQGRCTYNGKYVISVVYFEEHGPESKCDIDMCDKCDQTSKAIN